MQRAYFTGIATPHIFKITKANTNIRIRFGKAPAEKNGEGFLPHFFIDSKISRIKMRTRINDSIWKLLSK